MKTRLVAVTIAVLITMFGCSSFNNYYPTPTALVVYPGGNGVVSEIKPAIRSNPDCPIYQPPVMDNMPDVPLKQLAKASPTDERAIDNIQQKYIADLHAYISNYRHQNMLAYKKYLRKCGMSEPEPD
jgi:hypothetical protein